jgi:hypothetical protein
MNSVNDITPIRDENFWNTKVFIPVYTGAGTANTLKGFITALSIGVDAVIVDNPYAPLGIFSDVLDSRHIGSTDDRESFSTCRFGILKTEENIQEHLPNEFKDNGVTDIKCKSYQDMFSNTTTIDWYFNKSLIASRVYDRFMNAINKIQWKNNILKEVHLISSSLKNAMGVSVRTWKGPTDHNTMRDFSVSIYKDAILENLRVNNINTIFMSYDNESIESEFMPFLSGINIINYKMRPGQSVLQNAVINMLILSKCEIFVCNRISTYAECVFWLNGCNQKVTPLF